MDHNDRCKKLASAVQSLSQTELEEIFKMIHKNNCQYSKNNNGIFVNLAWIPLKLLDQLEHYVLFCSKSGSELKKYESLCDVLNKKLQNTNVIKGKNISGSVKKSELIEYEDIDTEYKNKVSSSMRFTLLKKKLSKSTIQSGLFEDELKTDEYLIPSSLQE